MLKYPVTIDNIEEFEKKNDIPINVFEYNDKEDRMIIYYIHKISSHKNKINLLLIRDKENKEKYHYTYITNINGLAKTTSNSRYLCDNCF